MSFLNFRHFVAIFLLSFFILPNSKADTKSFEELKARQTQLEGVSIIISPLEYQGIEFGALTGTENSNNRDDSQRRRAKAKERADQICRYLKFREAVDMGYTFVVTRRSVNLHSTRMGRLEKVYFRTYAREDWLGFIYFHYPAKFTWVECSIVEAAG